VSAGVDFYSDEDVFLYANHDVIISTGISWNPKFMPDSQSSWFNLLKALNELFLLYLIIQSRSGLAFKHGIEASNAGVIDQDYVSTEGNKAIIKVKLYNYSRTGFQIKKGDKICQGVP
jgi:dUTPase